MTIELSMVQKLSRLARISLNPSEQELVINSLNNLVKMINRMQEFNTDGVEPMIHPSDPVLRLREDVVTEKIDRLALQEGAPAIDQDTGLYCVPPVLD